MKEDADMDKVAGWKWRDRTVCWIRLKAELKEETNELDVGSK